MGEVHLKGPGDSYYTVFDSPTRTAASNLGNPDGYWRAYVSGNNALYDAGTYAFCNSGGQFR